MTHKVAVVIAIVTAFAGGYAAGYATGPTTTEKVEEAIPGVEWHWNRWEQYQAHMSDPKNLEEGPPGYFGIREPFDPRVSLAALVAADELVQVDLVFPTVPVSRAVSRHWIQFMEARKDRIVFGYGNSYPAHLQTSGVPPLHLQLWFKEPARTDVQQLIQELEGLGKVEDAAESSAGQ